METEQLIRTLAADNAHRARPVGLVLALALLAAAPVSMAMFLTELGVRPDVMTAMHNPFFDLKFVVTLALAISAIVVSLHLSRPEASLKGWAWLLLIPAGILIVGIACEMMIPQRLPMMTRLIGSNSRVCMTAIPLLSLPLLAAALIGLRHGAPTRPAVAGAIAGLLSAGLAATLYASHCTDDSPLFVATWYPIAIALVTAIGALAGSRVLRFSVCIVPAGTHKPRCGRGLLQQLTAVAMGPRVREDDTGFGIIAASRRGSGCRRLLHAMEAKHLLRGRRPQPLVGGLASLKIRAFLA